MFPICRLFMASPKFVVLTKWYTSRLHLTRFYLHHVTWWKLNVPLQDMKLSVLVVLLKRSVMATVCLRNKLEANIQKFQHVADVAAMPKRLSRSGLPSVDTETLCWYHAAVKTIDTCWRQLQCRLRISHCTVRECWPRNRFLVFT